MPALLKLLDLREAIVTADALNCQKASAEQILQQGGDYLFALKDNHPGLCEDVAAYFHWTRARVAKGADPKKLYASQFSKPDYGHGRREIRRCWCVDAHNGDFPEALSQWPGLRSIIMVERERCEGQNTPETGPVWGEPSREISYYLSSLEPDAKRIAGAVREHRGIENSLHWVLDMAFDEDHCRVRKDSAGINLATLRHLALNLIRQDKTKKVGIKIKMRIAGWDDDYMLKLLAGPEA